ATASESWRDMTGYFQVPGEKQRAPSLPLDVAHSATTQEHARLLLLDGRLVQRPSTNKMGFVAIKA
ncbi:hypothetical protein A2U01_0087808, partial [Trifolium medium]|nr:hypothetical protein [Trifolium medium]